MWNVVIPANTTALLHFPARSNSKLLEDGTDISQSPRSLVIGRQIDRLRSSLWNLCHHDSELIQIAAGTARARIFLRVGRSPALPSPRVKPPDVRTISCVRLRKVSKTWPTNYCWAVPRTCGRSFAMSGREVLTAAVGGYAAGTVCTEAVNTATHSRASIPLSPFDNGRELCHASH